MSDSRPPAAPSDEHARSEGEPDVRAWLARGAWGVAYALAVNAICGAISPSVGEAGWLRWLRTLADHPVRVAIAATLVLFTFSRPRLPPGDHHGSPRA